MPEQDLPAGAPGDVTTEDPADGSGPVLAGRYRLGEVVGRGGMADVHRAVDLLLHRPVAVKVLRDQAGDEAARARFTAEARTLAGLSHGNLVLVLDAGVTGEHPYLVMELVDGQTLAECCAGRALEPAYVASVGAQLADALSYAHGQGVVHRDVKPGNVLLGGDGRVRLADFGIARLLGDTVRHTRTGQAIGTAGYLSPEQVRGTEVGPASDVWSLGLVLLEALTGRREYDGPAVEAAVARLHRAPEVPTSLPAPWPELLARMTHPDPTLRPHAAEVAAALRAVRGAPDEGRGAAERTRLLATAPPTAPVRTDPRDPAAPGPAFADRAGDAVAAAVRRTVAAARRTPPHLRGALAAVVAILVLLVTAGLAGGDTGSPAPERDAERSGPADGGSGQQRKGGRGDRGEGASDPGSVIARFLQRAGERR